MKRKNAFLFALILILPVIYVTAISDVTTGISESTNIGGQNNIKSVDVGQPAPDFNLTDVDTQITHSLSDYLGKVVFLDLWATWCVPCEISLPYIRLFYDMYPEDMFVIFSIDIDESETESQVSSFRKSHDMDWIVGIEENNEIQDIYGSGFVPTFYIVNPSGIVDWYMVGIYEETFYDDVYGIVSAYLPDDTDEPEINDYNAVIKESELSIFNPGIKITANVSEDRKLNTAEATISTSTATDYVFLNFEADGDFLIVDQNYYFDPEDIYDETQISVQVTFTDFWENSNISTEIILPVTHYADAGPPTLGSVGIEVVVESDTRYNVTIYAEIADDLMLTRADVWLLKGESIVKSWNFEEFNATHMIAAGVLLNTLGEPHELTAKIILEDVAGNSYEEEFTVADAPTNGGPDGTNQSLTVSLIAILFSVMLLAIRRRKE
ncbi:MAG: TlpA family protein disulfide reductase [Candidatus Heimdallarchaeaceae archaeon]|jgi:thiol-disulfide isomerase/thioredoxin